jgi:hypothetical protein
LGARIAISAPAVAISNNIFDPLFEYEACAGNKLVGTR